MKDIPIFTGQFGVATLILREIPYKQWAYVMVRGAREGKLEAFLEECCGFCRMAGAERVLATADEPLDFLPHAHDMLELTCRLDSLPPLEEPVELHPVDESNWEQFRRVYNELFREIPNAATYTQADEKRVTAQEHAYMAIVDGQVAGIGEYREAELCAIGVLPAFRGLGRRLALTLLHGMSGDEVRLRVSSVNEPALRLYEKLGFTRSQVLSRWYLLFPRTVKEE